VLVVKGPEYQYVQGPRSFCDATDPLPSHAVVISFDSLSKCSRGGKEDFVGGGRGGGGRKAKEWYSY